MASIDRFHAIMGKQAPQLSSGDLEMGISPKLKEKAVHTAARMKKYRLKLSDCDTYIKQIEDAADRILTLSMREKKGAANQRERIAAEVSSITNKTSTTNTLTTKILNQIKSENKEMQDEGKVGSAEMQMRQNMFQRYVRQFHSAMKDYNDAALGYQLYTRERMKTTLKMVSTKKLSEEDLEEILDSGQAQEMIQDMLQGSKFDESYDAAQARSNAYLNLEQEVLEIYQIFKELNQLVDRQQESLDSIENHILKAQASTETAEDYLASAEHYQCLARKAHLACFIVVVIALGVLALIIAVMTDSI